MGYSNKQLGDKIMAQIVEVVGVGQVEFPDGMSKEAMASALSKLPKPKQSLYTEDTVYDPMSGMPLSSPAYGPEISGKAKVAKDILTGVAALPVSVATGVARSSGAVGIPQLISKATGSKYGDEMVNALGQIEKGMEQQGGEYLQKGANIIGQAAPFVMGGMGAVNGVSSPMGVTSISDKATQLASKIPLLPSYAQNILGNVGLGVTAQAISPEKTGLSGQDFVNEKLGNMATTGALSGALPVAGQALAWTGNKALQGVKSVVEPLYEGGREKILGRALREATGGESQKAISNLKAYQPSVSGTKLTAGEVSGVPSLAATQRAVMATTPEATNLATARQASNAQARTQALENIATDTRLGKYATLRERVADDLYEDALNKSMSFDKLPRNLQLEASSLSTTPAIKTAMNEAKTNAANRGLDIGDPAGSLRGLHETKMALDDQINNLQSILEKSGKKGAKNAELDGLISAKNRLLNFIENKNISPEYKQARQTYAKLSKPVEQLESIQKLAEKSVNPKDQQIYAGRFFNQLEALKKEGVLSPRQIQRLEAIADDLRKVDFGQTAGRGVGSDTVQKLAYTNMLNQTGIPNVLRDLPAGQVIGGLASRVGDVVYGNANRQLTSKLAESLMNPQETARLMELGGKGTSPILSQQQKQLAKILMMQRLQGE
jgi:hypothetical protein